MSAREFRFPGQGHDASAIPPASADSEHVHFYRTDPQDYFYDIESWQGDGTLLLRVSHGKPGKYLWRNKVKRFDDQAARRKAVDQLIKGRATVAPGVPFIRCDSSCRLALPAEARGGDGGGGGGDGTSSGEEPATKKQKREHSSNEGSGGAGNGGGKVSSADVLKMSAAELHSAFPFTSKLEFNYNIIFADKDHSTLTKPCDKAGENVFGHVHSIIVGHNPNKNKPNFWCTGTKEGVIVPYNLKLKLGMTLKGRPNHQSSEAEKSRVAAMYRECELRGGGFKKPK